MTTPSKNQDSRAKTPELRPLRFTLIQGNQISRSQNAIPGNTMRIPVKRKYVGAGPEA